MLDDPLRALDVHTFYLILELIQRLKELGKTIILSTLYLALVEKVCDIIAFLDNGRILLIGTPMKMKNKLHCSTILDVYLKIYENVVEQEDIRMLDLS